MTENSGFASFFGGDSKTDILSSVSNKVSIYRDIFGNTKYYGRYFYLGNLLIQFTDFSSFPNFTMNGEFTFDFPMAYTSNPYCVMVCPVQTSGVSYYDLLVTLVSFTTTSFTVNTGSISGTDTGNFCFVAIGPR